MRAALMRLVLAWLALSWIASAQAAAGDIHRFYGYAYDQASGRYLYTEVHRHVYEGERWVSGSIRYYAPDNQLIGEKTLDFSRDPFIPVFRLTLPKEGYEEAITAISPGGVEAEKVLAGQRSRAHLDRNGPLVADSGFHSFIVQHLDELQRGQIVVFDFAVAGRLASYRFRLVKVADTSHEGHPALKLRAEPDSLLRLIAPALLLTYDLQTRYLVEYLGVSNLHDPATGKAYPAVRIIYPQRPPAGAPASLPPLDSD